MGQAEAELHQKVNGWEIALEPVTFGSIRVRENEGRRPLRTEALEDLGLFSDVNLDRQEVLADEPIDVGIRISLGIQPSARSSHRCGVEIQEQCLLGLPRLNERRIDVLAPFNGHESPPVC